MKKIIYILSFTFIVVTFTSCWEFASKDICVYMDEETKEYCLFEEGTYWIYQDSATLEFDSLFITKFDLLEGKPNTRFKKTVISYEQYYMLADLAVTPSDSLYQCQIWVSTDENDHTLNDSKINLVTANVRVSRNDYLDLIYHFDFYHNGNIGETYIGIILGDTINVFSINDHDYTNVKQFSDENGQIWYIAKNIGLIRIEMENAEQRIVKNLIRYNINPYINN